jgi:hypothetical protein
MQNTLIFQGNYDPSAPDTSKGAHGVPLGYVGDDKLIYRQQDLPIGRVDEQNRLFRRTQHDEREVGHVDAQGHVYSHGIFEGGALGWVDPDGVVIQAGLIFGEEEVGFVTGPDLHVAGAALLLIFLPEAQEAARRDAR